ncbi:MAG: O-antigen ligase family protein [Candidatus Omnitrophica bacterium]|jgi:O-antigen ligase|nr:O-antigen ligase family protein [Candidatus Omnitrophota bacterium]
MFKNISYRLIIVFLLAFIAWLTFIPQPLQSKYSLQVKYALFIFLLLSIYRHKFNVKEYFFNKSDLFFWIYLALISVNIWFAEDKTLAWNFYRDLSLSAIPIYFLYKNEINNKNIRQLLYGLCLCGLVISLFGHIEMLLKKNFIYEYFVDNFFYQRFIKEGRMMSTLIHPNILGSYLVACVPIAYYFYRKAQSLRMRALNLSLFLLVLSALFLTYSRGTYLAFLLMLSIWAFLKKKHGWILLIWGGFIIFSIISTSAFADASLGKRFGIEHLFNYLRYSHRTMQYSITANMLKAHPFVGIGLNHYRMLFNQYSGKIRLSHEVMIPDSIYLMHLAETGLIGFTGLVLFLIHIVKKAAGSYKKMAGDNKDMFFALILGFTGLLINMATFDGFLWWTPFYLFWALAGATAGCQNNTMPRTEQ